MKLPQSVTFQSIARLAFPAILAGVAEPLISLIDLAVIGNMEGDTVTALAAVGLSGSFMSAIIWTLAQTKTSVSSIISQALGRDALDAVKHVVPQVILLNIVLGVLIYFISAAAATWIFEFYGAGGAILEQSISYFRIRAIGFPMTLAAFAIFGVFRGMQNTSWAMLASIAGLLVNGLLDYLFVYGYADVIPAMGLQGAAYASLIAQAVLLLIAIVFFIRKMPFRLLPDFSHSTAVLKKHIDLSANFFLRTVAINVAIYLTNRFATGYGDEILATQGILMNIWLFFSFFIDGFANAGNAMGGRLLGAGDKSGLKRMAGLLNRYAVVVAVVLGFICFAGYDTIGRIFTASDAVLLEFENYFWVVLIMQPVCAVAFVYDGIFKGWGRAVFLRNFMFVVTALGFIPTLFTVDYFTASLYSVWAAFFIWMLMRAGVLMFYFKKEVA